MPVKHWSFQPLHGKAVPLVDPATLSRVDRRVLWVGLQVVDSALAEMLVEDKRLKILMEAFDGRVVFEREEAERYFKSGAAAADNAGNEG